MASALDYHPKQILCPMDMSVLSDLALKYAHVGAQLFGAKLTVLNAVHFEYPRYLSKDLTNQLLNELDHAKADTRKRLAEHVHRVLGDAVKNETIAYRTTDIDPAQAILQALEQTHADLVVMGTHGYSRIKHWILGSVAEKVLHLSKVPVLTIRQKIDDFIDIESPDARPGIGHILCPCNFSPSAAKALQTAAAIAKRMDARLTVLFNQEAASSQDKARLQSWIKEIIPTAESVDAIIRQGEAADRTLAAAEELDCDMIVIGICHQPFGQGTVVGRTTERVAHHAPVPVLAVPYFPTTAE